MQIVFANGSANEWRDEYRTHGAVLLISCNARPYPLGGPVADGDAKGVRLHPKKRKRAADPCAEPGRLAASTKRHSNRAQASAWPQPTM
jgi:hypothetical protein